MGTQETVFVVLLIVTMVSWTAFEYYMRRRRKASIKYFKKLAEQGKQAYADQYAQQASRPASKLSDVENIKKAFRRDPASTTSTVYHQTFAVEANLASYAEREVPQSRSKFHKHKLDCDSCGAPLKNIYGNIAECESCGHTYYLEGFDGGKVRKSEILE